MKNKQITHEDKKRNILFKALKSALNLLEQSELGDIANDNYSSDFVAKVVDIRLALVEASKG